MRYRLLGPLEMASNDGCPVMLGGRERALLAVLLLNANRVVAPDRLIEVLWGDEPPATAANALQAHVSRLRKKLVPAPGQAGPLCGAASGYRLDVRPGELDLERFQELSASLGEGPAETSRRLGQALALWRGAALTGVSCEALAGDAARLEELRMVALERRIEADLALGRHHDLVPELEAVVHDHPLREGLRAQLMLALYRSGRQADALAVYRQGRAVLAEDLGIDPAPALQALEVSILQQAPEVAAPPAEATGLGPAQPAGAAGEPEGQRHNLPQVLSSFVGREPEVAALRRRLGNGRLVVLVGPGGVGKTRLALQVAAGQRGRFSDGVWLVELAALRNPDLVVTAVAEALGVPGQRERPVLDAVLDTVGPRQLLVVLDNCEHLVERCAELVEALLRRCPGASVLATSREPLGLDGEQVFRLAPLLAPSAAEGTLGTEELTKFDAVQLFVERARAQRAGFDLEEANAAAVAGISRRLDGIPLAIELAAARLRSMSVFEVEANLADRFSLLCGGRRTAFPRHQTLKALIDWSYELLGPPEQAVLRRLSVFAGGWRLDAAQQVCAGGPVGKAEVPQLLGALVDKSLVEVEPAGRVTRYRLLETVRQYAAERLAESSEAEMVARSHALAYLALAEQAAPGLRGPEQAEWVARIDEDLDNIRVAGTALLSDLESAEGALRLVVAQRWYWALRAHYHEGLDMAEAALGLAGAQAPTALRAQALLTLLSLRHMTGELTQERDRAQEALAIARARSDTATLADLLALQVFGASAQGDTSSAVREMAQECIDLARQSGDPHLIGRALAKTSFVFAPDRTGYVHDLLEQAVAALRTTGDKSWLGTALNNLADTELQTGDLAGARAHLGEAIAIFARLEDSCPLSTVLCNSGLAALLEGDRSSAWTSFSESFAIADKIGARANQAYSVLGLGLCASADGEPRRAVRLHGTSRALFDQLGRVEWSLEARLVEEDLRKLRQDLGPEVFAQLFEAGRQLGSSWCQIDSQGRADAVYASAPATQPSRAGTVLALSRTTK